MMNTEKQTKGVTVMKANAWLPWASWREFRRYMLRLLAIYSGIAFGSIIAFVVGAYVYSLVR